MAFQSAVVSANNGLLAMLAVGAPSAPSTGDAGLFQTLLAGATTATPVATPTPNAAVEAAPAGGALALLLQTQDVQPAQTQTAPATPATTTAPPATTTPQVETAPTLTPALITDEAAPAAAMPAAFATAPVDKPVGKATAAIKLQTAPAAANAQNVMAQVAPETEQAIAPVAAAVMLQQQAVAETPEQTAPAETQPAATTPDVAQAIMFAPLMAAQASATPASTAATPAKTEAPTLAIEADASPQEGAVFKKTAFTAQTKSEPANGAVAKVAGEALATPQTQTAARIDASQPGATSPITGFDAPRPATDSISTPVARAVHGAAAMQVAQHVAQRFDGKSANFEVRLDPAELGRVDVKITVDHDKRVTASVSADSPQTLSDLRGAARDIERALNEAGLDLAQGGLSFDLNQRQANDEQFDAAPYAKAGAEENAGAETVMIAARPFGMERWSASGVDVWA